MKYNVTIRWKSRSETIPIEADQAHDIAALALEKLNSQRRQRRLKPVRSQDVWETDVRIAD